MKRGNSNGFETELKYGKDPKMKTHAQDIIKSSKGEIEQMNKWLDVKSNVARNVTTSVFYIVHGRGSRLIFTQTPINCGFLLL